mgnify:FL=1
MAAQIHVPNMVNVFLLQQQIIEMILMLLMMIITIAMIMPLNGDVNVIVVGMDMTVRHHRKQTAMMK